MPSIKHNRRVFRRKTKGKGVKPPCKYTTYYFWKGTPLALMEDRGSPLLLKLFREQCWDKWKGKELLFEKQLNVMEGLLQHSQTLGGNGVYDLNILTGEQHHLYMANVYYLTVVAKHTPADEWNGIMVHYEGDGKNIFHPYSEDINL